MPVFEKYVGPVGVVVVVCARAALRQNRTAALIRQSATSEEKHFTDIGIILHPRGDYCKINEYPEILRATGWCQFRLPS